MPELPIPLQTGRPMMPRVIAGMVVVVLLSMAGPASAGTPPGPRTHSCCCGPTCKTNCCCLPKTPVNQPPAALPTSVEDEAELLAVDPSPCVGPLPCGGDSDASSPLTSPRERPATLAFVVAGEGRRGRPPLPRFVDRFMSQLPGDLPDEPPKRA